MTNRTPPQGAPQLYQTYSVSAPLATHWRPATCAEVDCPHYLNGWTTTVDTSTDLGQKQAAYIVGGATRGHVATMVGAGMWEFRFGPGQKCFRAETHRVPLERDAVFRKAAGDFRAFGRVQTLSERAWLDDFGAHQEHVKDVVERG